MATSRFKNNPNQANYIKLQVSDNTAVTKIIKEIKYYGEVPELPSVSKNVDIVSFLDRGSFQAFELGDDTIEPADFSLTLDLTAADVQDTGTSEFTADWFTIMNNFKDPSDNSTALTSTNSGTVTVRNGLDPSTGSTTTVNIASDIDTLRLEILFDDGSKQTGYKWEHVQPMGVSVSTGDGGFGKMTLNFRAYCAATEINSLTTNA